MSLAPLPIYQQKTLANDAATGANTTPINLTGMTFDYVANATYRIEIQAFVTPAAATTGCGFALDTSTAISKIGLSFFHQLATTGTLSGGSSVADATFAGVSSGMPAATIQHVSAFGILITTSNAGTAQLQFRSETTAVTTCNAGTTMMVTRVA